MPRYWKPKEITNLSSALERPVGKILSVFVGKPKAVEAFGRSVTTAIFKEPAEGRITLRRLNLEGDEQADLTVHGGPDKAIYTYASEHYSWWQEKLPGVKFPFGKFGENLTTEGLLENEVYVGDEFRVGTAVIKVTQPRLPCYKLGVKFGRNDVIKTFMQSGFSGVYFSVIEEGELGAGDEIKFLRGDDFRIKIADVANLFNGKQAAEPDFIQRCMDSQLAEQMKMFVASL